MKLHELKRIIDSVIELHGEDANAAFVYQRASGRTGIGDITSYRVGIGAQSIHFNVDYPRGRLEQ